MAKWNAQIAGSQDVFCPVRISYFTKWKDVSHDESGLFQNPLRLSLTTWHSVAFLAPKKYQQILERKRLPQFCFGLDLGPLRVLFEIKGPEERTRTKSAKNTRRLCLTGARFVQNLKLWSAKYIQKLSKYVIIQIQLSSFPQVKMFYSYVGNTTIGHKPRSLFLEPNVSVLVHLWYSYITG